MKILHVIISLFLGIVPLVFSDNVFVEKDGHHHHPFPYHGHNGKVVIGTLEYQDVEAFAAAGRRCGTSISDASFAAQSARILAYMEANMTSLSLKGNYLTQYFSFFHC